MKPAWSFSSLEMYRTCPKQYHEVRVLKKWKEEKTVERAWGDAVHAALEKCLKDGTPLPAGMEVWQPIADQFRGIAGTLVAEQQFAMTEDFRRTKWFAKDVWLRVIIDALWLDLGRGIAKMVDWKTGKPKRGSDQLALFALAVFLLFPQINECYTAFVWLKNGTMTKEKFVRADIPRLWSLFAADLMRLENAHANEVWPAKTSGLCSQWCPVLECEFNGKRRHWNG